MICEDALWPKPVARLKHSLLRPLELVSRRSRNCCDESEVNLRFTRWFGRARPGQRVMDESDSLEVIVPVMAEMVTDQLSAR